jgi:hypothetical protein
MIALASKQQHEANDGARASELLASDLWHFSVAEKQHSVQLLIVSFR